MLNIAARRLRTQGLTGEPFTSAVEAVRWLGAVQSQDYAGAKWALGQRTRGVSDAQLDRLFDEGAILRTHVMRPTWHFVLPEDIRWMIELTGHRVRRGLTARYRELEIDEGVVAGAKTAFAAALSKGRHLTRPELGEVLLAAGISPEGQRLAHLLMGAELDGLIASGPRHGKAVHLRTAGRARTEGPDFGPHRGDCRAHTAVLPGPRPGPGPGLRLVVWPDDVRRQDRYRACRRVPRPTDH